MNQNYLKQCTKFLFLIAIAFGFTSNVFAQNLMDISPSTSNESNIKYNIDSPIDSQWDIEFNYDALAVTGAAGNTGAVYIPTIGKFWTSKWGSAIADQWNLDGTLDMTFTLPFLGTRNMCFDGTYVYHATSTTTVQIVDPVTKLVVGTIPIVGAPNGFRSMTYNPDGNSGAGSLIGGNWSAPNLDFYEFSMTGTLLRTITNTITGVYGIAYDNWTTGGPYLWVWGQGAGAGTPQYIHQMDYSTGIYTGVQKDVKNDVGIGQPSTGIAGGMFITDQLISGEVTMGGILQGSPDLFFGYEIVSSIPQGPGYAFTPDPVNAATDVTVPNNTLSWLNPTGATSNAVWFGTDPASLSQIYAGLATTSVSVTGLLYSTQYYWRVDAIDGTGTTTGTLWSFTTMADCGVYTTPFIEGFELAFPPLCWTNSLWVQDTWGGPHTGLHWAYSNTTGSLLTTPEVSLTANSELKYWYRAESSVNPQDMDVLLSTDGINFTTTLASYVGITNIEYIEEVVDLSTYTGGTVFIRFNGLSGAGGGSYGVLVDDVSITEIQTGINPPVGLQASITGMDIGLTWLAPPDNTLRWDSGVNEGNAVGFTAGGDIIVGARFPASITTPLIGKELEAVEIYIQDLPSVCVLNIYGEGTPTEPGTLLHSEDITSSIQAYSWNAITLSSALVITGEDIWITYSALHVAGEFPAGIDAGPHVADGDWVFLGTWQSLFTATGGAIDGNWNIAGFVYDAGPLGSQPTQFVLNSNAGTDTKSLNKGTLNSGMLTSVKQAKYGNDYQNHSIRQMESKFKQNFVNDGIDATLTGYNVYRDAGLLAFVTVGTESYDDIAVAYGNYIYDVTAVYTEGESDPATIVVDHSNPDHITILVDPLSATYWTGNTEGTIKTDGEINTVYPNVGWAAFDVSAIPVGSIIVSIEFNGYVNANNWPYWAITSMGSVDPVTDVAATIFTQVNDELFNGTEYIYNAESGTLPLEYLSRELGGTATADLAAALAQDWFAIGFIDDDGITTYYINFDGWSDTNPPYLEIVYMLPPTLPVFSITPDTKDFGYAFSGTSSADQTFTITNIGAGTLTISSAISITGTDASQFVLTDGNTYPINLLTSESATVDVNFSPTSSGAKTADLQIVDNTADATQNIPLSGTAMASLPYAENFDGFTAGTQLACSDPVNWDTWTNTPCGDDDALISTNYAFSGLNSVLIDYLDPRWVDLIKHLGNLTAGKWEISFQMYIPTGKVGYFNTLSEFGTTNYWAMEVYFNAAGSGELNTEDAVVTPFTWVEDTWQSVQVVVDLDSDVGEFWFNGVMVHTWQWTNGATTGLGPLQLAANDFFAPTGTASDEMYIDDYAVSQFGGTTFPLDVTVMDGWNMVSIPGTHPTNDDVTTWWPNLSGDVFAFTGNYTSVTTVVPGAGYWLNNSGAETYSYPEINIVPHDPIIVPAGWSMIGGYENIAPVSGLIPSAGTILSVFEFGTGYATATDLVPGYGYWINMSEAGTITIPDPSPLPKGSGEVVEYFKEDWGKIIITDNTGRSYTLYAVKGDVNLNKYELPPMPPVGMFDIRYGSDRVAEDISSSTQSIDMSGIAYPITVRVEGMDIRLQDVTGTQIDEKMKSGGEITISNAQINKLMVSGELIPDIYALEQNYPNPFNPSTVIEFSLPEDVSNVQLTIYDVLGQRVAQLVNTSLKAGKYQYQWNAGTVSTGMYIYELRTDKFVSVKKMVLMK